MRKFTHYYFFIFMLAASGLPIVDTHAQNASTQAYYAMLKTDPALAMPKLEFDDKGDLVIKASATSSTNDFDYLDGKWKMYNRKLNKRLVGCTDWTLFESDDINYKILVGTANMDTYSTTHMPGPGGTPGDGKLFEGITLRLFNPQTRLWSIYWVASTSGGVLDPPVVGSFENNVGHFFCKDKFNGQDIIVVFRWDARDKDKPVWSQAFSTDKGRTWEWNHYNVSIRVK
jgi:hypothetical protein